MAVAAGSDFSAVVTEDGCLWELGDNLCDNIDTMVPACVGVAENGLDGECLTMVAAGGYHTMCVTSEGMLFGWGRNEAGQLGQKFVDKYRAPGKSEKNTFGGAGAVMVACGNVHTVVLTVSQCVWTCGDGSDGQLGHGSSENLCVFTQVPASLFAFAKIVMVACGDKHSVVLDAGATIWAWGENWHGQLGMNDERNRWFPTYVHQSNLRSLEHAPDEVVLKVFGGHVPVLVAAGGANTAVVTEEGSMWVVGCGANGRLGLHKKHTNNILLFRRVGTDKTFGGSHVLMAACGQTHTLAVTKKGEVWSFGRGREGVLGHHDGKDRMIPTRIHPKHFEHVDIVSVACGARHSAAVTAEGTLFMWGGAKGLVPAGMHAQLRPALVSPSLFQGVRIGRCYKIPQAHMLAFAMGMHARLGAGGDDDKPSGSALAMCGPTAKRACVVAYLCDELARAVIRASIVLPPAETRAFPGLVRLLGGGFMCEANV